jgi:hypothetical protein
MGKGARSWSRSCRTCGQHYRLTNWMWRWVDAKTLEPAPMYGSLKGCIRIDTHQLRHAREAMTDDTARPATTAAGGSNDERTAR